MSSLQIATRFGCQAWTYETEPVKATSLALLVVERRPWNALG